MCNPGVVPIVLAPDQTSHQYLLVIGPDPGPHPALHTPHGSDAVHPAPRRQTFIDEAVPDIAPDKPKTVQRDHVDSNLINPIRWDRHHEGGVRTTCRYLAGIS
jgi:hypothetical protein